MFTPTVSPLPHFEFTVRDEDMAEMEAERARHEAELDAQIEANFDAEMERFETQIEDEEIAELAQAARELAQEEAATYTLRRAYELDIQPQVLAAA